LPSGPRPYIYAKFPPAIAKLPKLQNTNEKLLDTYKQSTYKQDTAKSTYVTPVPPCTPVLHNDTTDSGETDFRIGSDFVIHTEERTNGKNFNASADYFWLLIFSVACRLRFTIVQAIFLSSSE